VYIAGHEGDYCVSAFTVILIFVHSAFPPSTSSPQKRMHQYNAMWSCFFGMLHVRVHLSRGNVYGKSTLKNERILIYSWARNSWLNWRNPRKSLAFPFKPGNPQDWSPDRQCFPVLSHAIAASAFRCNHHGQLPLRCITCGAEAPSNGKLGFKVTLEICVGMWQIRSVDPPKFTSSGFQVTVPHISLILVAPIHNPTRALRYGRCRK
jgi:hypothetical protein